MFEHLWRAIRADDEELAEGQVGEFLGRLIPSFQKLDVAPVRGEYDEEARRDELDDLTGFSWGAVGARVLERLNRHLADAGRLAVMTL